MSDYLRLHQMMRALKFLAASLLLSIPLASCQNEPKSIDYSKIPQEERQEFRYFKVGEDWYKFPEHSITHFRNLTPYTGPPTNNNARDPRILVWEVPLSQMRSRVIPDEKTYFPGSEKHDLYQGFWNTRVTYDVDHQRAAASPGLAGCKEGYVAAYATGRLGDYLEDFSENFHLLTWGPSDKHCFVTKKSIYFDLPILMSATGTGSDFEGPKDGGGYFNARFAVFDTSRSANDVSFPPAFHHQYISGFSGEPNVVFEKMSFFEDYLKLYHIGTELPVDVRNSMESQSD